MKINARFGDIGIDSCRGARFGVIDERLRNGWNGGSLTRSVGGRGAVAPCGRRHADGLLEGAAESGFRFISDLSAHGGHLHRAVGENPLPTIQAMKFYEVQDSIALTGHFVASKAVIVSSKTWEGLSEEQRGWIIEAAEAGRAVTNDLMMKDEANLVLTAAA